MEEWERALVEPVLAPLFDAAKVNTAGGGSAGNVDAERSAVIEGAFKDAYGNAVQVSVRNPAPATGGTDRQTVASARLLAPESLRALTRTVARKDFEINARRLSGVARALMLTSNEDPTIAENTGILYVIPQSQAPGAIPTPALKNLVLQQVTEVYPCTLTFQVSVQATRPSTSPRASSCAKATRRTTCVTACA